MGDVSCPALFQVSIDRVDYSGKNFDSAKDVNDQKQDTTYECTFSGTGRKLFHVCKVGLPLPGRRTRTVIPAAPSFSNSAEDPIQKWCTTRETDAKEKFQESMQCGSRERTACDPSTANEAPENQRACCWWRRLSDFGSARKTCARRLRSGDWRPTFRTWRCCQHLSCDMPEGFCLKLMLSYESQHLHDIGRKKILFIVCCAWHLNFFGSFPSSRYGN